MSKWTRDWPSVAGWYWWRNTNLGGHITPVHVKGDSFADVYGEELQLWDMTDGDMFHPMEQPPAPPDGTMKLEDIVGVTITIEPETDIQRVAREAFTKEVHADLPADNGESLIKAALEREGYTNVSVTVTPGEAWHESDIWLRVDGVASAASDIGVPEQRKRDVYVCLGCAGRFGSDCDETMCVTCKRLGEKNEFCVGLFGGGE